MISSRRNSVGWTWNSTSLNTTNFDNNLSVDDNTVQKALDTLDDIATQLYSNYTATTNPTVDDDSWDWYVVGSRWINISDNEAFICLNNTLWNAVWEISTASLASEIVNTPYWNIEATNVQDAIDELEDEKAEEINDLSDAKTGGNSVFLGVGAGTSDDGSNNNNTGIGNNSLYSNTTGYYNTASGYNAGRYTNSGGANETSSNSFYLWYNTRALFSGDVNEIVIGSEARGNGSNTITFGNDDVIETYLKWAIVNSSLSSDPTDPATGKTVQWVSDWTWSWDAWDVMLKINVWWVVKIATLVDFSTI